MPDRPDAEPTPMPHDPAPHPGVAEIDAVLARVAGARLAGRPLAARTSFQDAFDCALQLLGVIGDARRYLGEAALASTGLARPDYVPLTRDQLNDSLGGRGGDRRAAPNSTRRRASTFSRAACGSSGAAVCGAGGVMAWERGRGEGARGRGGR